jgi:hypothetical protein
MRQGKRDPVVWRSLAYSPALATEYGVLLYIMIIDDALETSASAGAELLAVGADFSFDLLNT